MHLTCHSARLLLSLQPPKGLFFRIDWSNTQAGLNLPGLMLHFQTGIDLLPGRPAEARKTLETAIDRRGSSDRRGPGRGT
jgi:hypothetical protein